jgi:P27 family predicted phage terminase small subunit
MGARGPAPKGKGCVAFRAGVPKPPAWLDQCGRMEYRRAVREIGHANGGQQMDMALLATYAQAYSDVRRLTMVVRKEGETLMSDKGNVYMNPNCNALSMAKKTLMAAAAKLAFSPSDRARVPASAGPTPAHDKVAEFAGG